jgi:hypothetical protein
MMIKGIKILIALLLISYTYGFSQQLSHQVLVPAAGLATSGTINFSQTIGETATEKIEASGFILTQGFHQPGIKISTETPHEGSGVEVFPNPATDFINIRLFGDEARRFTIELINITGTIVKTMKIEFISRFYYIQQIEVERLTIGFYFVRVTSDDGIINRIFKIEKM